MKNLYIIRGIPGSGKTTFAETICDNVVSADDYFVDSAGNYNFDASKLRFAHQYSQQKTETLMKTGVDVAVANTFTQKWEMKKYYELAEKYSYRIFSLIVENRHNGKNVHDVPDIKIDEMKKRFEIKL